jgi:hypothetical protein
MRFGLTYRLVHQVQAIVLTAYESTLAQSREIYLFGALALNEAIRTEY